MNKTNNVTWEQYIKNDLSNLYQKHNPQNINLNLTSGKYAVLTLFLFLLFIIPGIIMTYFVSRANAVKNAILREIDREKYYYLAFQELSNNKIKLDSINDKFKAPVLGFFPSFSHRIWNDNIINFIIDKNKFSVGTKTSLWIETIYEKNEVKKIYHYTRHIYFNVICDKNLNLNASFYKPNFLNKRWKTKTTARLESIEFHNIFTVQTNDQIEIRKLLTPKIMLNLIQVYERQSIPPQWMINQDKLTYFMGQVQIVSQADPRETFCAYKFYPEPNDFSENIIVTIEKDYERIIKYAQWFFALDIE